MNQQWIRFLPLSLRSKLGEHPTLWKIIGNTSWLFADRILRMGVGLIVGVWIARYLGPEQFGLFNYATAVTAIFGAIASLGLENIAVREIVQDPEKADRILGTTFVLKLIAGFLVWLLIIGAITLLRPNNVLVHQLVAIIAAATICQAGDTIDFWFQSQVQSKYTVLARNTAFILTTCIRIILIQRQAPLVAFAWAGLAEGVFSSVGLAIAYQTSGKWLAKWRFCITCAKQLLLDSFPLIFSSIMVMVYMRIDQVMLAEMLGDNEVGIYSAAVRLAEAWYFIPMAIVASVFPLIVEAKKHSEADFYGKLQKLYNLMALLAYLVIVPTTLLSGWIVHLIFGDAYAKAAFMLAILVWASLFVNLGLVKGAFLTAMNWTKLYFATIFLGCFVNIILNFVLIPTHGGVGAAIATCIAQGFANYVTCFLLKPLNKTGSMLTKAIFLIKNGT